MNRLQYKTKVFLPDGKSIALSTLRKSILAGEDMSILGRYPNGVIAPSRVERVDSVMEKELWHVKVDDKRAIHASKDTGLLTDEGFKPVNELVVGASVLVLGPSALIATDGIKFALAGILRSEYDASSKPPSFAGRASHKAKSGFTFGGEYRAMSVTMRDTDNFVITSGIIVNGENN